MAVSGSYALVGAPDDLTLDAPGSAVIFEKIDTAWQPVAVLKAGDGTPADRFGSQGKMSQLGYLYFYTQQVFHLQGGSKCLS